jgi:hypothetical protein
MASIFISFSHEEIKVAKAVQRLLQDKLVGRGAVFLSADQKQILAGEDWLARIRKELDSAKIVILVLSPRSITQPWLNFEVGAAWLAGKTIIPVCFGGLRKESLPAPYSGMHAVDLRTEASYLLNCLAKYLNIILPRPYSRKREDVGFIRLFEVLDCFVNKGA